MTKHSLPWFKFFQDAWLKGTRDLLPDQRGIYIDCLCLMYEADGPLRNDDDWVAHRLHVKVRKWRDVKEALINAGKLVQTPDGLVNSRANSEIIERSSTRARKSVAAEKREENSRMEPELPFENNKHRPQLWSVSGVHVAQQGPHARASSDPQMEDREKEIEELKASKPLPQHLIGALIMKVGQTMADGYIDEYYRNGLAAGAACIEAAFPGWLRAKKNIDLDFGRGRGKKKGKGTFSVGELAHDALKHLCGQEGTLPTAQQLQARAKRVAK